MKYCSECGSDKLIYIKPKNDTCKRLSCSACNKIFYHNPIVIAGGITEYKGKYLMCQRAIEPRIGSWTLPAGFMEDGETVEEAASREIWEETGAKVELLAPYSIFSIPTINEVYIIFRAKLIDLEQQPGPETQQIKLFSPNKIPWDNIFYPAIKNILQRYIQEKDKGTFGMYMGNAQQGTIHFMQQYP